MSYAERTDVEAVFGVANVAAWADLDNDGDSSKIDDRVTLALSMADCEINDKLRGGIYVLPLVKTGEDEPPETVVNMAAMLAGVFLYESRGVQDFNPDSGQAVHRLTWYRKRVESTIREITSGVRMLDAELACDTHVPEIIE